ncbi:hypothetical protein BIW11_05319 [Tropilaelaps mercedesae]|uniref:Uncharacterized protein n=1 Tax=Tropilaelaps mercedesae TaxID=418985 RepID=A0A1V9Y2U8_9ACAR|nr:hypothetical protein BIW11_05319 [Tropilaelaps mercedesae]
MSQGKLKVKTKVPKAVRKKTILKRDDRSVPRKAKAITVKQKIKHNLEKNIRAKIEEEMRSRASHGDSKSLSKTQSSGSGHSKNNKK